MSLVPERSRSARARLLPSSERGLLDVPEVAALSERLKELRTPV